MIDIDREHPEFKRQKLTWRSYRDLYAGGRQFRHRAAEYLLRRQKEPLDVYSERLHRVFYQNYIGSIIDWYSATLFRRGPTLHFQGENETGQSFLSELADDCDLRGTNLTNFFRRCFSDALVTGRSYILNRLSAGCTHARESGRRGRNWLVARLSGSLLSRRPY